jgi:hypothetical protein
MRACAGLVIALAACGPAHRSRMYPAGTDRDDGYGDLAQTSARLLTRPGPDATALALRHARRAGEPGDGASYDGAPEPGDLDPPAAAPPAHPPHHYRAVPGLAGAVEGVVTWRGAPPAAVTTACGPVAPGVRVAPDRAVGGVLVTIDRVEVGRALPGLARPATVGGTVAKRGCALAPALQVVTPLPASVAIHGDASPTRLRVTFPVGARVGDLAAAGRIVIPAQPGVTQIEGADGALGAAWLVATDTPAYAITDDDGRYRLDELAPGSYELTLWRPALPVLRDGRLVYGPPVVTHRSVKVDPTRTVRLDVALER